jgi:hypothetical protein
MTPRDCMEFIMSTVARLLEIRDHPTPAEIDNLLIDLQALTLSETRRVRK